MFTASSYSGSLFVLLSFFLFRGLVGFKKGGTPNQTCCSILRTIIVNCLHSGHIQKVMAPFSVSPTKSS